MECSGITSDCELRRFMLKQKYGFENVCLSCQNDFNNEFDKFMAKQAVTCSSCGEPGTPDDNGITYCGDC